MKTIQERLEEKIERIPECGCWIWMGIPTRKGYGVLSINNKGNYAHRVSWELAHFPIPKGMQVCHRCDTPSCINPSHLFLGTPHDNTRDMIKKGRQKNAQGEECGRAKLTTDQVRAIRADIRSANKIAHDYNIHENTVYHIRNRRGWRSVL